MSVWIKICGMTSLEDALLACEAGVDAVGFVFAPSPRRVTPAEVAAITPHLPPDVEKIGVFVDASIHTIYTAVRTSGLTGVQLHAGAGPDWPAHLRELMGPSLRILRVVPFSPKAAEEALAIDQDPHVEGVLVDNFTAAGLGGTGVSFDWDAARKTVFGGNQAGRRIAAGGLNPENVAEAIEKLRPWGIDVASGVESEPGRKDRFKVLEFVRNAKIKTTTGIRQPGSRKLDTPPGRLPAGD
jgi:phosphoribosylanthranilate isomerase